MVISQPQGIILLHHYRASVAPQIALNASRDTFMFYTCNYNIRVTHRNDAIKHNFLHESDPRRDHRQIVLYSFCRSMLALHLAVKICFKSFCDLSTLALHTSVGHVSSRECQQDRTLLRNNTISENIPNIWHKSSTKHKEVRPNWNDKNDNANYAPSYHMEGFTNGSGLPFLKKYSIKCEKI